jgi:hypothetical protein
MEVGLELGEKGEPLKELNRDHCGKDGLEGSRMERSRNFSYPCER